MRSSRALLLLGLLSTGLIFFGCLSLIVALALLPSPRALPAAARPTALVPAATRLPIPTFTATASATARPSATATLTRTPSATPTPTPMCTSTPTPNARAATATPTATSAPLQLPRNSMPPDSHGESLIRDFFSATMNNSMPYQIFLPPGYQDTDQRYPVLYLLHGWGGDFGEWGWYNTQGIAEELMRRGEIPPFIIVTPEGDKAYWFNHAVNGPRWGDYVAYDLINFIDSTYRTIPHREARAIGGLSMGALGAMQLALNHPNTFSIVGMHSPALRRVGDPDVPAFFGDQSCYAPFDPFSLVERTDALKRLTIYIDIGEQDDWLERTTQFRQLLDKKNANYEWHVNPGEHAVEYFQKYPIDYLRFYGAKFSPP